MEKKQIHVLMVCLGNICRSPSAEVVFRARLLARGLDDEIIVDSAGTGDWHVGSPPDARAIAAGARRRYDLSKLSARQVDREDFEKFDYIVAMDKENFRHLRSLCPPGHQHKLLRLMDFSSSFMEEVPDPYYSTDEAFDFMLDLLEEACDKLFDHIVEKHGLH